MTILVTALKVLVRHVLPEIARKVIVRHFKTVAHVRKGIALRETARRIKIVAHALREIAHKVSVRRIKTAVRVHHARQMLTPLNSVVGMCPMALIPAHV